MCRIVIRRKCEAGVANEMDTGTEGGCDIFFEKVWVFAERKWGCIVWILQGTFETVKFL